MGSMTRAGNSAPAGAELAPRSRIPRWLLATGLGVPVALIVLAASPLGTNFLYVVVGIPALLFLWAIAGVGALIVGVRFAMRREWRRCTLALALPLVLLAVAADPTGFVRSCNHIGDVIHFIIAKPYYDRQIAALPADRRPDWSCSTGAEWSGLPVDWSTTKPIKSRCRVIANPPIGWRRQATAN